MARRRQGRWANQAALEALLKFGPEAAGLLELQRAAQGNFRGSVRSARAAARGTVQAVRAARPEVRDIYSDAAGATRQVSDVIGDTSGLPASMRAAIAQEQTGYQNRLGEERAAAMTDLTSRRVGAIEGRGAAIRSARDKFADDLAKILQSKMDLAQRQGAFTQLRTGELRQAAQERADKFALKTLGLGFDPKTGLPLPGGPADRDANGRPGSQGGGNRATNAQIAAAQDVAGQATSWITRLKGLGLGRGDIAVALQSGREERVIPLHDPSTGKPLYNTDGTPKTKKVPGVPQVKSQLLLSAALDQAFKGYVSQSNWKRLAKRGLRPADLGFVTYRQWKRRAQTPGGAINAAGQVPVLGTLIG